MDDQNIWSAFEKEDCSTLIQEYKISSCGYENIPITKKLFDKKCYIAFGEICPICTEPIFYKNNSNIKYQG